MTNPLLEKYEEIYGEKKEEVVEEKKSSISECYISSGLPGGMGSDHIIFGGSSLDTINLNPTYMNTVPQSIMLPAQTEMDKLLCKIMNDVSNSRAVVASMNAEVDKNFTGFGGQIRYTIEIVGTYP